jgi:hypothetical protein
MDTILTPSLRQMLRTLPGEGVERELALRRATELAAASEAAGALAAAARRTSHTPAGRDEGPPTGGAAIADVVLSAASALWRAEGTITPPEQARTRDVLRRELASSSFLDLVSTWIAELRDIASTMPRTGACTIASGMQVWLWTMSHFRTGAERREPVMAELADAFCALIAARCQVIDFARGLTPSSAPRLLRQDLCHVQAARAAGQVATLCAELVYGYRLHPAWDAEGCSGCYGAEELDELEGLMPGIASAARGHSDVIESDGSHPSKAGPCVRFDDVEGFTRLRAKLDGCLTGARFASDRAAAALAGDLAPAAGHTS